SESVRDRSAGLALRTRVSLSMLVSSPWGSHDTNKNTNKSRGYQQMAPHRCEQPMQEMPVITGLFGLQRTNANKGERRSGAPGRTRTSTMLPPPDFESGSGDFPSIPLVSWAFRKSP